MRISDWSSDVCSSDLGDPPVLYARAVVETVKIGLKRFRTVLGRNTIANVDIITDVNHHNDHPDFMTELDRARLDDGRFKGVNRIVRLDSTASRLLQLADVVAYARKWIVAEELNARSEERREGNEGVSTCRSEWAPYHY